MFDAYDELQAERRFAKDNGIPVLRPQSFDLLTTLVAGFKPQRILEIGTAWGHSGIAMLKASPSSHLTGLELDDDCISKTRANYKKYGVEKRATLFAGDAGEIITVLDGKFDFIFLDGPKGHYARYLPYLLQLLNKGGVIFADNINFMGFVLSGQKPPQKHNTIVNSMKEYLHAVTTDKTLHTSVLDLEDGVAITVKL